MKKLMLFFAFAAMLLISVPANAQLNFGVKGGLNLSKLSISNSGVSTESKTGWFIGPMAEFKIPIVGLGVDAAALYNQTELGAKGNDATMRSIEVPVNLKWSVGLGDMLGVYVAAGPQFGFNVGDSYESIFHMKKNTTTFNVGAGVKLINHIQAGVNYNFALENTATIGIENLKAFDVKNNTWQISAAYIF